MNELKIFYLSPCESCPYFRLNENLWRETVQLVEKHWLMADCKGHWYFATSFPHSALTQTSSAWGWIHSVTSISLGDRRRGCENNLPASSPRGSCWTLSSHTAIYASSKHIIQLLKMSTLHFVVVCILPLVSHLAIVTHSLLMVVFSSFASLIVAELCSVDSGVSRSTSTMGGSACGRIPLQKYDRGKIELFNQVKNGVVEVIVKMQLYERG